jgi:uncharacterized protein (TIGR00369 family)
MAAPVPLPPDPAYADRVRASFARQQIMALIGATLTRVEPGAVEIRLPFRADLSQQHGFVHAGVITTIVDSACGYAALTLAPPATGVLSIEFKANFLAPARGSHFLARGRVLRAGRTVIVCAGDVVAVQDEAEIPIATMLATIMAITGRAGVED